MAGEPVIPTRQDTNGRKKLEGWLNKSMRIKMTDGRTLIGTFVCTDKDKNVILGSCQEYLKPIEGSEMHEPRVLGLAMVPGCHIVSVDIDSCQTHDESRTHSEEETV